MVISRWSRKKSRQRHRPAGDGQRETSEGRVLSVGRGRDEDGKRIVMDVKAGDKVLFAKYAGTEIKIESEKLLILRESDILAIVTE
jgi:chaperonin GroES